MHDSPTVLSKKINLTSSVGDVFEVDYDVALMSKTIEDAWRPIPLVISRSLNTTRSIHRVEFISWLVFLFKFDASFVCCTKY